MNYDSFYQSFLREYNELRHGQRVGQFFMNHLSKYHRILYREVPPDLDCFYNDKLLNATNQWVFERWDQYPG